MDLFHKIMALVDKNSGNIPEGDYLQLCDTIQELREQVKPPSFLIDQNRPMQRSGYDSFNWGPPVFQPTHVVPITDGDPSDYADSLIGHRPYPETATQREQEQLHQRWGIGGTGELPSDPDTAAQRDREQFHQQWREGNGDEEGRYPGLNEFLQWREGNGDEEDRYPGLNEFLRELHEEWSEPGSYYPPPMQTMQDVVAMEVD